MLSNGLLLMLAQCHISNSRQTLEHIDTLPRFISFWNVLTAAIESQSEGVILQTI